MTAIDDLINLLESSGATMTFDSRRYARAAKQWPDYLPPMFGEAAVAVERWGMNTWMQWEARAPEAWPAPLVAVGDVFEARNATATWEQAENPETAALAGFVRITVAMVAGECFLSDTGSRWPMSWVNNPHVRRPPVPAPAPERHPLDRRHTRVIPPDALARHARGIAEKAAEYHDDIIGHALTVGCAAAVLGLPSGPITPIGKRGYGQRLKLVALGNPLVVERGLRRILQKLAVLLLLARGEEADRELRDSFWRADGRCLCSWCARPYWQHIHDPFEPWLNVLCTGERVKL